MRNFVSTLVGSSVLAGGMLVFSSVSASAAIIDTGEGTCDFSQLTSSDDCGGYYSGNDTASDIDSIFGDDAGTWMEVVKVDSGTSNTGMGVTLNVFNDDGTMMGLGERSGTWSATGLDYGLFEYVAVLKAGTSWSAYQLVENTISGMWNTEGTEPNRNGIYPALSHFTLYKADADNPGGIDPEPSPAVPEPSTVVGLMFLTGALAVSRRRS